MLARACKPSVVAYAYIPLLISPIPMNLACEHLVVMSNLFFFYKKKTLPRFRFPLGGSCESRVVQQEFWQSGLTRAARRSRSNRQQEGKQQQSHEAGDPASRATSDVSRATSDVDGSDCVSVTSISPRGPLRHYRLFFWGPPRG